MPTTYVGVCVRHVHPEIPDEFAHVCVGVCVCMSALAGLIFWVVLFRLLVLAPTSFEMMVVLFAACSNI